MAAPLTSTGRRLSAPPVRGKRGRESAWKGEQLVRHLRGLRVVIAWLLLAIAAPAHAQSDASFDRYFEAADRFDRLAAEAAQRGGLAPQLGDPQFAALFPDLTDPDRVFVRRTYPPADLHRLGRVLTRAVTIGTGYLTWGSAAPADSAAGVAAQDRNMIRYQAEFVPMMLFMAEGTGVVLRTLLAGLDAAPDAPATAQQRASIATVRGGLSEMLKGLLGMITFPGMAPERGLAIARNMAALGPDFAAAMTLPQRREIAGEIRATRDRVRGQTRAALDRALRVFSDSVCEGLCAI
jgi:hypothetical protein